MPTLQLLDAALHSTLRLRAPQEPMPHFVPVFASEFVAAAASCPVVFSKDAGSGHFYAGAIFGLVAGENLVGTAADRGGFEPLSRLREGFYLSGPSIAIDRESARFSETEGEPLFDDSREPAPALRQIQRVLGELHSGMEQTRSFIATVSDLALIEPVSVVLDFDGNQRLSLEGLYTVSLDRLRDVNQATVMQLFRANHLQLAYTMAASLRQINRLAHLRNQRL
jgi:hypothetical protein